MTPRHTGSGELDGEGGLQNPPAEQREAAETETPNDHTPSVKAREVRGRNQGERLPRELEGGAPALPGEERWGLVAEERVEVEPSELEVLEAVQLD